MARKQLQGLRQTAVFSTLLLLFMTACATASETTVAPTQISHLPTKEISSTSLLSVEQTEASTDTAIPPTPHTAEESITEPTEANETAVAPTQIPHVTATEVSPTPTLSIEQTMTSTVTAVPPTPSNVAEPVTAPNDFQTNRRHYCIPDTASAGLSASSTTVQVGQTITVSLTLSVDEAAPDGLQLGLPQYRLAISDSQVLAVTDPIFPVHTISLTAGQSDMAALVLQAVGPGQATLTGDISYELWVYDSQTGGYGSWTGCLSQPLTIIVEP